MTAHVRKKWAQSLARRLCCPHCRSIAITATGNDRDGDDSTLRFRCLTCNLAFEITNPSYVK